MSAEADLWGAAFRQAFNDACHSQSFRRTDANGGGNGGVPTAQDVRDAWAFLTAGGEWGKSREFWASLNNVNPDVIRAEALRLGPSRATRIALMQGELPPPAKARQAKFAERDAAIAADWSAGVSMDAMEAKYAPLRAGGIVKVARRMNASRPDGWEKIVGPGAAIKRAAKNRARNAEIMRLHDAGKSLRQIASIVGLKLTAVHMVISRLSGSAAGELGGAGRAAGGFGA